MATNKAKTEIHFLTDRLKQAASLTPEIKQFLVPKNNIIVFKELPKNTLGKEGYRLQVTEDSIEIEANEKNGFFMLSKRYYNFFRLKFTHQQLLLKEVGEVPAVFIEDTPRFAYRGMHLDVSRHFYPVSFVKKYIDLLAMQKMNYFHWHLTDDQGWRIEIKRYPFLTEKEHGEILQPLIILHHLVNLFLKRKDMEVITRKNRYGKWWLMLLNIMSQLFLKSIFLDICWRL